MRLSVVLLLISMRFQSIYTFKVKLSQDEPELVSIYNNYRELYSDESYIYLKSAGLLRNSDLADYVRGDNKNSCGRYLKATLVFYSSDFFRKTLNIRWYAPATDRTSLHVYDNPMEINLASGPQVNQQSCGLLLDYMIHMANKHYKSLTNSTEISIFNIIQSFGAPNYGLHQAKAVFPGDYRLCLTNNLNVMKNDLDQVSREESEKFFSSLRQDEDLSLVDKISNFIRGKLGLLLVQKGTSRLISQYKEVLLVQPTRYCLAGLRWPSWPNGSHYRRNMVFRIGVCLPDECDSNSLKLYHDKIKRLTEFQTIKRSKGYYVDSLYCLPDEKSNLRNVMNFTSTRLFIYFNIIWLSLIILATLISSILSKSKKNETVNGPLINYWAYLKCWCLNENMSNFWMNDRDKIKEDHIKSGAAKVGNKIYLKPLEGLKVVSAFCVILVHTIVLGLGMDGSGRIVDYLMSKTIIVSLTTICEASVDNFFVMTGLVTTLALIRRPKWTLMRPTFWIQFFVYRYIRIVPMYLLFHWSLQSFARFLGSGPYWDYATSYTASGKVCENDSSWGVVFPIANLKSPTAHCNPVGWYLANDIQFSLFTPIFIILFLKKPLVAHLTILATTFLVMANHVQYYLKRPEPRHGLEFSALTIARVLNEPSNGYTYPQYRCISYFVGLSTGHLLHLYETGSIGLKWPRAFVSGCKFMFWFVFGALCLVPHLTLLLPLDDEPLIKFLGSAVAGTLHGLTSFAASAFMLLICTGHFGPFTRILSKSFLQPIANCSLCTLLVHIPLIYYHIHAVNAVPEVSVYYFLTTTIVWFVESLLISAIVHIVYELPMRRFMVKLIFLILSCVKRN